MSRLLIALLLVLLLPTAHAAWEREGQLPSGAIFKVAVPEGWQPGDGLVVFQRDLALEPDRMPGLGPLAARQLAQGWAVASTGYSQAGWALFASDRDNRELLERFRAEVGAPGRVLGYGQAMGGLVALQMAEDPLLAVDAALALCPVAAGHRAWESALDLRLLYDQACAGVEGGALPMAADRPWLVPPEDLTPFGLERVVLAANRCLGINREAWRRDPGQQARLDMLLDLTGIADPAHLLVALGHATLGLSDLVRDPGKLAGADALGNQAVDYGPANVNAAIRRVPADPFAALAFRIQAGLRGGSTARALVVHGAADPLLPAGHVDWLAQRWPPASLASVVLDDTGQRACDIAPAELAAAWDALVAWGGSGAAAPDGIEIQARCLAAVEAGEGDGPCRIATGELADRTPRLLPRSSGPGALDARFNGHWHDPDRPGEGWLLELLDDRSALVYGFIAPASSEHAEQRWLIGTGLVSEDGILVEAASTMRGGTFAGNPASGAPQRVPWGRLQFVFDDCGSARLRYQGPEGYGNGERRLLQLAGQADHACGDDVGSGSGPGALSGSWYQADQPGHGLVVNVGRDGAASVAWFGYDPVSGEQAWLFGSGRVDAVGELVVEDVVRPSGTRFDRFLPAALAQPRWGSLRLRFHGCDAAVLNWQAEESAWGAGELPLTRLTRPVGLGDCGLR
ncbi:MAG: hypothetical protein KF823_09860 [Xanthomonadales bacterium]|nr:hypothetical protein [Xanthomonadales bacterium]